MNRLRNILLVFVVISMASCDQQNKPVSVIFDTDMGPDYDDVGAITLLHAFADRGEVNILATMASTRYEGVASVLNVLNTYFGRPEMPIGVPKGIASELKDFQHWTDTLQLRYPHTIRSNSEVPDAVALYRKILSEQNDNSVTIVTVGFLTNLSALLRSQADQYSPLNGRDLVQKKVNKLVSMAGRFPSGPEYNIKEDVPAARYVYENFPTTVLFSGFEIGDKIRSGIPLVANAAIRNSPVKDVFRICTSMVPGDKEARQSWDQTAVLVAVKGYEPWYTVQEGRIVIEENGNNQWNSEARGQHHLVAKSSPADVAAIINDLMMHQPLKPK